MDAAVTWKTYVDALVTQLDLKIIALESLTAERVDGARREAAALNAAAHDAICRSEAVAERRFASGDAFRIQLNEQAKFLISREVFDTQIAEMRHQLSSLSALKANELLQHERVASLRREADALRDAGDKAIQKTEASMEKRFEAFGTLRTELSVMAGRFVPRELADAQIDELRKQLRDLTARLDQSAGVSAGTTKSVGYMITVLGIGLTVLIFVINFMMR